MAKSVICSSLLKAAMFGADANWGRVLCAIGYSGCDVDISKVDVAFRSAKGAVTVCVDGAGIEFSEEKAKGDPAGKGNRYFGGPEGRFL